jgi:hypothetical protein
MKRALRSTVCLLLLARSSSARLCQRSSRPAQQRPWVAWSFLLRRVTTAGGALGARDHRSLDRCGQVGAEHVTCGRSTRKRTSPGRGAMHGYSLRAGGRAWIGRALGWLPRGACDVVAAARKRGSLSGTATTRLSTSGSSPMLPVRRPSATDTAGVVGLAWATLEGGSASDDDGGVQLGANAGGLAPRSAACRVPSCRRPQGGAGPAGADQCASLPALGVTR